MSYAAIRTALAARLQQVSGVGRAHAFVRFSKAGHDSNEFRDLFTRNSRVNVWQITRSGFSDAQDPGSSRVVRTHNLEVYSFIAVQDSTGSENFHQDTLDLVATNLAQAPRTLGGACHSHGLVEVASISRVMFYEQILCHEATLKLTVEELLP